MKYAMVVVIVIAMLSGCVGDDDGAPDAAVDAQQPDALCNNPFNPLCKLCGTEEGPCCVGEDSHPYCLDESKCFGGTYGWVCVKVP